MAKAALEGLRIVEYGQGIAPAYAAKLFADLGAEVWKVEPPEGDIARRWGPFAGGIPDPERSALFLYLNGNKRGVTLDLRDPASGEAAEALFRSADAVLHNFPPGSGESELLSPARFQQRCPHTVLTAITPFGASGPYASYRATDLTVACSGGWSWLIGQEDRADLPPLRPWGAQTEFQSGLVAAIATLGALLGGGERRRGQFVDVSAQEVVASALEINLAFWSYRREIAARYGRHSTQPWAILPTKDGHALCICLEEEQWQRAVEMMGNPEWAAWPVFADGSLRSANWDVLRPCMEEWLGARTSAELMRLAVEHRIAFAPVLGMAELCELEQLMARRFFVPLEVPGAGAVRSPGAPYRLSETPWQVRRLAPERLRSAGDQTPGGDPSESPRGEHGGAAPLEGVRVVDFGWAWAGPYCGLQLAYLGAEVIKVEGVTRQDLGRRYEPFADGIAGPNRGGFFNQYAQGKLSLALDLRHPRAREVVRRLVRVSDVVIENFRPGVLDRLDLGYRDLRRIKPEIVMASLSAFGATGPLRGHIAYGASQVALGGLAGLTGYAEGPPNEVGISYGDPNGGLHGAFAILAALWHRRRTGRGQWIDLSQLEALVAVVPGAVLQHGLGQGQPERLGNRDPHMAPHGIFPCARDAEGIDRWVGVAVPGDAAWRALCAAIGRPGLADDPRFATLKGRKTHEDTLETLLRRWTSSRDRWEVTRVLQQAGVPAFPVLTNRDLTEDPHLRQRGFLVELDHPEVGRRTHAGIPWRMSETPCQVQRPAPLLGQHNTDILRGLLGYSEPEAAQLIAEGVVESPRSR